MRRGSRGWKSLGERITVAEKLANVFAKAGEEVPIAVGGGDGSIAACLGGVHT